jgi:hypothetical protein
LGVGIVGVGDLGGEGMGCRERGMETYRHRGGVLVVSCGQRCEVVDAMDLGDGGGRRHSRKGKAEFLVA